MMKARLLAALLALSVACGAGAQAWKPEKAVEIVVPNAAGGANDNMARLIQKIIQEQSLVPAPVLVMNKPGGNQTLAAIYVRQHSNDAHYLLYSTSQVFGAEIAGLTRMRYTELTPIALLLTEYPVISVAANSPIRNMRDLTSRLQADSQSIAFGMVSRGGSNHVALVQAVKFAGIDPRRLKTIVFKSNVESYLALAGGHLQAVASSATAAQPFVQQGSVRIIGIGAPQRQPGEFGNVPTIQEQGFDVRFVTNWRGVFGSHGITAAQAAYWDETFAKLVKTDAWVKTLEQNNSAAHFLRGPDFVKFLEREYAVSRAILTELGFAKQ